MSQKVIVGILLWFSVGLAKGQLGARLHNDDVYIFPRIKVPYNETTSECEKYGAFPAELDDAVVRNEARTGRFGHVLEGVWNVNKTRNSTSDLCDTIDLKTGHTDKSNCTLNRPFVCKGSAWANTTTNNDDTVDFSNVKLRYTDARDVCKERGRELNLMGQLIFISSAELQNRLSTFTHGSDTGYWISSSHDADDSMKMHGYENWVENRTVVEKQDSCVQMKPDGKWDNTLCHSHIRFICESKKEVVPATEPAHTTKSGEEMVTTISTKMPTKTVTSKSATTDVMVHTTVHMPSTTSGSATIECSIIITFAIAAMDMFLV